MNDLPLFRMAAPSAPGSASSRRAALSVTDPMRARCHRLVMLELARVGRPVSREALAEATGIKETALCGRLSELRGVWIEVVRDACLASSGLRVDGYQITRAGMHRLRGAP